MKHTPWEIPLSESILGEWKKWWKKNRIGREMNEQETQIRAPNSI